MVVMWFTMPCFAVGECSDYEHVRAVVTTPCRKSGGASKRWNRGQTPEMTPNDQRIPPFNPSVGVAVAQGVDIHPVAGLSGSPVSTHHRRSWWRDGIAAINVVE